MIKSILAAALLSLSSLANAQYIGTVPPNVDFRFTYSKDTDNFEAATVWVGAAVSNGFGARLGQTYYSGKQDVGQYVTWDALGNKKSGRFTNNVKSESTIFQFTFVDIGENHSFQSSFGVRSFGNTSNSYNTGPINGVNFPNGGDNGQKFIGDAELKLIMTDSLTLGLTVAIDTIESARSVQTGTTYIYTAADMDLLLGDNLNLNVIAGNINYSDDNNRMFVRTKTTWTFLPEEGVSTYLKTRSQIDSNPKTTSELYTFETDGPAGGYWYAVNSPTNYYSPKNLNQASIGLQYRKPFNGLVFTAAADYGHEWATLKDGSSSNNPIYSWLLGLQTNPGRKTGTTFGVTLIGSNSSLRGTGGDYNWYGLTSWLKVPF